MLVPLRTRFLLCTISPYIYSICNMRLFLFIHIAIIIISIIFIFYATECSYAHAIGNFLRFSSYFFSLLCFCCLFVVVLRLYSAVSHVFAHTKIHSFILTKGSDAKIRMLPEREKKESKRMVRKRVNQITTFLFSELMLL